VSGLALFLTKFKKNPIRASLGLAADYFIYVGMVCFVIAVILLKYPLKYLDRAFGLELREKFINLTGKISRA
jgi:hypothetical protein